jgi:hypothetical protein
VRYFLTGRQPKPSTVLLVESGSRELVEKVAGVLHEIWGPDMRIDVATCYALLPRGLDEATTRVYRLNDFRALGARLRLLRELAGNGYSHTGIVCSGEPILLTWKWALALRLPSKIFVINENGDYFWLDSKHLAAIRQFAITRAGLTGTGAIRTPLRVLSVPFALVYLTLYAAAVHARRLVRLGWRLGRVE